MRRCTSSCNGTATEKSFRLCLKTKSVAGFSGHEKEKALRCSAFLFDIPQHRDVFPHKAPQPARETFGRAGV